MTKAFPQILLTKGNKLDWRTPKQFFDKLDSEFGFQLDAATSDDNPLRTPLFYTEKENGIYQPWVNTTFCNPPYGRRTIDAWLNKARLERQNGVTSVFLLPVRTGTIWFHEHIYQKPYTEIRFVKGRLIFEGQPERLNGHTPSAPFDSMIVVFRT